MPNVSMTSKTCSLNDALLSRTILRDEAPGRTEYHDELRLDRPCQRFPDRHQAFSAPHRAPRPGGPTWLLSLVCRRGHSRKMFSPFPAASECNRGKPQRVVHIPDAL